MIALETERNRTPRSVRGGAFYFYEELHASRRTGDLSNDELNDMPAFGARETSPLRVNEHAPK